MKVVGRERTEKIRNKEKIIINLTFVLSVYAMAEGHVPWVPEVFSRVRREFRKASDTQGKGHVMLLCSTL